MENGLYHATFKEYRTEKKKCNNVILKATQILDRIVERKPICKIIMRIYRFCFGVTRAVDIALSRRMGKDRVRRIPGSLINKDVVDSLKARGYILKH